MEKWLSSSLPYVVHPNTVALCLQVDIQWNPEFYKNVITNKIVASLYEENSKHLGIEDLKDEKLLDSFIASTDMGNVSHVVPSIHPMFYIGSTAVNHTRPFTEAAGNKIQHRTV